MRSRELPIQQVQLVEVDLAERLRVTAERLASMPAELAASLSLTAAWQGHSEAEVRRLATAIASAAAFSAAIDPDDDMVTVTFRREPMRSR